MKVQERINITIEKFKELQLQPIYPLGGGEDESPLD